MGKREGMATDQRVVMPSKRGKTRDLNAPFTNRRSLEGARRNYATQSSRSLKLRGTIMEAGWMGLCNRAQDRTIVGTPRRGGNLAGEWRPTQQRAAVRGRRKEYVPPSTTPCESQGPGNKNKKKKRKGGEPQEQIRQRRTIMRSRCNFVQKSNQKVGGQVTTFFILFQNERKARRTGGEKHPRDPGASRKKTKKSGQKQKGVNGN